MNSLFFLSPSPSFSQVLVDAANNSDNSHLLSIPAGVLPSDVLANRCV